MDKIDPHQLAAQASLEAHLGDMRSRKTPWAPKIVAALLILDAVLCIVSTFMDHA